MNTFLSLIFPYRVYPRSVDAMLLVLRLLFGGLMMWHGISKIENFEILSTSFPNPLGIGVCLSLYLAIFAEVFCSAAVIIGAFYRLALIPLLITMCVALFIVHNGQSFAAKELATIFFVIYALLFLMGAGYYSLDNMIAVQIHESFHTATINISTDTSSATAHQQDSALPTDGESRQ